MTIRNNWCEDCQEECTGHARLCTTCGGTLTSRPSTSNATTALSASFRAMPDLDAFLPAHLMTTTTTATTAATATTTADLLRHLRAQVQATTALADQALGTTIGDGGVDEWQAIPAALLDPQNTTSNKRPTSRQVLDQLPRETLSKKSPSLFHVAIQIKSDSTTVAMEGVTSELGPLPALSSSDNAATQIQIQAPLFLPTTRNQRTGKEPLTTTTTTTTQNSSPCILVMERGHGISFFDKAFAAQQFGAKAVIVINDKTEPWPYVMKDSQQQSRTTAERVTIPVVMISMANGQDLVKQCCVNSNNTHNHISCTLTLQSKSHHGSHEQACVICTEPLQLGQTVLTLTNYCGHAFHERCALQWLQHHNTCPYCRRTLPTDNEQHEQERRRQMTLTATTARNGPAGTNDAQAFYS